MPRSRSVSPPQALRGMIAGAPARRRAAAASRAVRGTPGAACTKRARRPRAWPRRRSWNSSAAPVQAGSVPTAARPASGPWSPATCRRAQRLQRPPRRRARTCASTPACRARQPSPIRSNRCGARITPVVRQPAPAATAPDARAVEGEREGGRLPRPRPRAAPGRTAPSAAVAAAPSFRAWRRVRRWRGTSSGTRGSGERIVASLPARIPGGRLQRSLTVVGSERAQAQSGQRPRRTTSWPPTS